MTDEKKMGEKILHRLPKKEACVWSGYMWKLELQCLIKVDIPRFSESHSHIKMYVPIICNKQHACSCPAQQLFRWVNGHEKKVQVETFSSFGSSVRLSFCAENLSILWVFLELKQMRKLCPQNVRVDIFSLHLSM